MKDSGLKIAALALLLTVFVAVVATSKWADNTPSSSCRYPSEKSAEISSQVSSPPQQQMSSLSIQADTREAQSEIILAVATLAERRDKQEKREKQERRDRSTKRQLDRLREEPDDGAEPPDNSKDTYGDADIE